MTKLLIAVVFSVLLLVPLGAQNAFAGFPCPAGFTPNLVSGFCEMPANANCPVPPSLSPVPNGGVCESLPITACPVGGALIRSVCLDGPACLPSFILNPSGKCDNPLGTSCLGFGFLDPILGVCTNGAPVFGACPIFYTNTGGICTAPVQCQIGSFNGQFCEVPNLCPPLYSPNQGTGFCETQPTQSCLSPKQLGTSGFCEDLPTLSCPQGGNLMGMVCTLEQLASVIGGKIMGVNSSALLLAGAQTFSWMIPVILSGIGIGLFVVTRKNE